ncbi:MAG: hypothetical protein AAF564_25770, partial [Bacteroidota bacterium]
MFIFIASQDAIPVESEAPTTVSHANQSRNGQIVRVVVANRNAGTISLINTKSDTVEGTYALSGEDADNNLFVPSQNSDVVIVWDRTSLAHVQSITVPGAHGAGMPFNGATFYTTNLPNGGTDGLYAVNTATGAVSCFTNIPLPVPHNIALAPNLKAASVPQKLYITHSGATANSVSVFDVSGAAPTLVTAIE